MLMPSHVGILMMLVAQGRGDLLDYVPSESYWQSKHVTVTVESLTAELTPKTGKVDISSELAQLGSDQFAVRDAARQKIEAAGAGALDQLKEAQSSTEPEVARVAKELAVKYAGKGKAQAVRQLMAIRTLGERKEKSALTALAELEKSKDPFVSQYAHRAALQIQDKPVAVTVDAAQADADVWLFPKSTGILLQEKAAGPLGLTLARMVENMPQMMVAQLGVSKDKFVEETAQAMIDAAEQVGDVRFDGLTVGIADNVGENGGWATFVARGKFDQDAVGALMENSPALFHKKLTTTIQGNVRIYELDDHAQLILSGDDHLAIVMGPGAEQITPAKEALVKAFQTGKGDLADSELAAKLITQVDTKNSLVWGVVAKISDDVKKELAREMPVVNSLESATLQGAAKEGSLHFAVEAAGTDQAAIAAGVDSFNTMVGGALGSFKQLPAAATDAVKPLIEIMESLKATAKEQKASLTCDVKIDTLAMGLGILYSELRREDARMPAEAPAEVNSDAAVPAPANP